MKEYTNEDLKTFERNEWGWLICPSGDYTAIKKFPVRCKFGGESIFSNWSRFGKECRFGSWCTFGYRCSFGEKCRFDNRCKFGFCSRFGERCSFGAWSSFGRECNFGVWCSFGEWCGFCERCNFGERCVFGELNRFDENCSHEGLTNSIYVAVDRIGSELRKTYFFKAEEGYFVRAGCFFGTLDEFKAQVHETHGGTIHETTYLMACELAVKLLDAQWK